MFACEACQKTFANQYILQRHLGTQGHIVRVTQTDMFTCKCGRRFKQSQGLSRHRRECITTTPQVPSEANTTSQQVPNATELCTEQLARENEELQKQVQQLTIRCENQCSKTKRKPINQSSRQEVCDHQGRKCNMCKCNLQEYFHIDHIMALQFGGTNDIDNLQALCAECHHKKTVAETRNKQKIHNFIRDIINESS